MITTKKIIGILFFLFIVSIFLTSCTGSKKTETQEQTQNEINQSIEEMTFIENITFPEDTTIDDIPVDDSIPE
ncbi:MAG: hypothetical protein KatS3mg002_0917 [Candidatus Woesearchaeota archaeon]|nr:MAG: hypothetical protein KatS3mg002_0917 [Candidatus Woesearchaeota archaeon]